MDTWSPLKIYSEQTSLIPARKLVRSMSHIGLSHIELIYCNQRISGNEKTTAQKLTEAGDDLTLAPLTHE